MATDIKKALIVLKPSTKEFKKSEVDDLVTALQSVTIGEMTSDKDKESFLQVSLLVKELNGRLKKVVTTLDEKHKPGIKELEAKLAEAKEKYREQSDPFKAARRELDRIDTEARDAIGLFMTAQIEKARQIEAPAPGSGAPVFMPAEADASKLGISKGGHDLTFAVKKTVKVLDLEAVPANLCHWEPDQSALGKILTAAGIKAHEIKVQADGTAAIKIKVDDLPENLRRRVGVKERTVIDLGGCAGVEIVDVQRAVVK